MFFGETLYFTELTGWAMLPIVATLYGVFSVAYSARFVHDVFFNGEPVGLTRTPHEPPRWMLIPVEILVVICILVGMLPAFTVDGLLRAAAGSVLMGQPLPAYSLSIWHGFNLPLLMSVLAFAGGVLVYSQRQKLFDFHDNHLIGIEGKALFEKGLNLSIRVSRQLTMVLENGSLQRYLSLVFISAIVVGAAALWPEEALTGALSPHPLEPDVIVGGGFLIASSIGVAVWHRHRLFALILLGVVGLFSALAFTRFSGPDLALTQLAVEFVTTVLLLLALYFVPRYAAAESSLPRRLRDAAIALLAGAGVAALTWAVLTRPHDTISGYFLDNSVPGGGGTNVVNVILVDFRGFDTLGEVTVLAIAALGILALLQGLTLKAPDTDQWGRPWASDLHPLILRIVAQPLLPLALLISFYLFLRGHNLPGGGFVAGLVTAVALVLQYMASGIHWAQERRKPDYLSVTALGLLFATLTGVASWAFGFPFLTSAHTHLHWPVIGDFEIASAMAFDLGVYLTVVGVVLLILANLGKLGDYSRAVSASPTTDRSTEESI
jgi:multicomponent K+:H+ antiporter subunit A